MRRRDDADDVDAEDDENDGDDNDDDDDDDDDDDPLVPQWTGRFKRARAAFLFVAMARALAEKRGECRLSPSL
eukprot:8188221-Pyramimonas_sp.AAC.1